MDDDENGVCIGVLRRRTSTQGIISGSFVIWSLLTALASVLQSGVLQCDALGKSNDDAALQPPVAFKRQFVFVALNLATWLLLTGTTF